MRANHQLESRMRETRLSGSEGGAAQQCAVPTPIVDPNPGRPSRPLRQAHSTTSIT